MKSKRFTERTDLRDKNSRPLPHAWHQRCHILQLALEVWWHGGLRCHAPQRSRKGEPPAQAYADRHHAREPGDQKRSLKKVVRFHLTVDTLAVRLVVPATRVHRGLTPPRHPVITTTTGTAPFKALHSMPTMPGARHKKARLHPKPGRFSTNAETPLRHPGCPVGTRGFASPGCPGFALFGESYLVIIIFLPK